MLVSNSKVPCAEIPSRSYPLVRTSPGRMLCKKQGKIALGFCMLFTWPRGVSEFRFSRFFQFRFSKNTSESRQLALDKVASLGAVREGFRYILQSFTFSFVGIGGSF